MIAATKDSSVVKKTVKSSELKKAVTKAISMFCDDVVKERKRTDMLKVSVPQHGSSYSPAYVGIEIAKMQGINIDSVLSGHVRKKKKEALKKKKMLDDVNFDDNVFLSLPSREFFDHCNDAWIKYSIGSFGYDFLFELSMADADTKLSLLQKHCGVKEWKRFHELVQLGALPNEIKPSSRPNALRVTASGTRFADATIKTFESGMERLCSEFFPHANIVDQAKIYDAVKRFTPPDNSRYEYEDSIVKDAIEDSSGGLL